ncbi:sentrin-specific protease [Ditylenchus destructor]|uniref:Sentrin-specific protease n=1 Tax=Ditylenchus destructor TaxID=166010 RepID=A0AAD4N9L9_9BILA|nr:sentrin-specific protease [Ditylenchus destructor]
MREPIVQQESNGETGKLNGKSGFAEGLFSFFSKRNGVKNGSKDELKNDNGVSGRYTPARAYYNDQSSVHEPTQSSIFDYSQRKTSTPSLPLRDRSSINITSNNYGMSYRQLPSSILHHQARNRISYIPTYESTPVLDRHEFAPRYRDISSSQRFSPYGTPFLERTSYRERLSARTNTSSLFPSHGMDDSFNLFRPSPKSTLESVDADARDEYEKLLKQLNDNKTPNLPFIPTHRRIGPITKLAVSKVTINPASPNTVLQRLEATLAMIKGLPNTLERGKDTVKGGVVGKLQYGFPNSAPSPSQGFLFNKSKLSEQPPTPLIDLTDSSNESHERSKSTSDLTKLIEVGKEIISKTPDENKKRQSLSLALASTSTSSPIVAVKAAVERQMRYASMEDVSRQWRERKYKDESESRQAQIRELEKEVHDRTQLEGLILERRVPEKDEFPDLPEDADGLLASAWNICANPNEVFTKGFDVDILRKDLLSLRGLEWLNDEVVNFYMNLICERSRENDDLPKTYAFNTFFYPNLSSKGYNSVRRWTRKIDIFSFELLIIPVHLTAHWCLAVVDLKEKCITYYDSMLGSDQGCLNLIKDYLKLEHKDKKHEEYDTSDWKTVCRKDIPRQLNGSDCGMFSCKFAEFASRRAEIVFDQRNMPYYRRRMVYEICKKALL